jgi:hypothetical protein
LARSEEARQGGPARDCSEESIFVREAIDQIKRRGRSTREIQREDGVKIRRDHLVPLVA